MQPSPTRPSRRIIRSDRGEGVISTAIAVLVMAFIGAAMWVTFNAVWNDTAENTEEQVEIIGTDTESQPSEGG